jgi:Adenosine deaminase
MGKVVGMLDTMVTNNIYPPGVVTRIGHGTHASFSQLAQLAEISQKHNILLEANLSSNLATGTVASKAEMQQVMLKFLFHEKLKVVLGTDGGGVMGTTMPREYELANEAINRFTTGKTGLRNEEAKVIYYYDKSQIPKADKREDGYTYLPLPEGKRDGFTIDRLRNEEVGYYDNIAPNIGTPEQNPHPNRTTSNSGTSAPVTPDTDDE